VQDSHVANVLEQRLGFQQSSWWPGVRHAADRSAAETT
jgi:hypothetical protein